MFGLDQWVVHFSDGTTLLIVLVVAVLLGLRHASDPDHLTAVTTLVTNGRGGATRLGFTWGLGHASSLLALGVPIVLWKAYLPAPVEQSAESLAILGHADLLSDAGLAEPERIEHLSTIREQGSHLLTMISDILEESGYEIVGQAESGVQAIERYKSLRPDLVTMDIVMPDMGGIDAVREICKFDPAAFAKAPVP